MLKQPVGVVNYTNVVIVRLKIGKKRFEIPCYPNKVQQYRQGVYVNILKIYFF
jgi:ribosome maturation protein SDO1